MWKEAEEFLAKDKYIAPLITKYGHCTLKPRRKKYYFEDLVDAIVQQQLSMKAASAIFNRVKETIYRNYELGIMNYGKTKKRKTFGDKEHKWRVGATKNVEITPEKILTLTNEELRTCGLSRAKIVYVKDLSEKVISGQLEILDLDKLPDKAIIEELTEVKGIGEWTAQMFLMFTLARPDIFPVGDLGLRNAFDRAVKKGLNREEMEKSALRWKPYRTIASWYIWKTLEN